MFFFWGVWISDFRFWIVGFWILGHWFSSSSFCGDILIVLFKKKPGSTFLYKTLSQDFSLQHSIHFSQHKAAFAKVFLTVFLRKITSPQRFMTPLFPDTYERFSPTLRDYTCSSDPARPYDIFSKVSFPTFLFDILFSTLSSASLNTALLYDMSLQNLSRIFSTSFPKTRLCSISQVTLSCD